jgi:hypothetical protein
MAAEEPQGARRELHEGAEDGLLAGAVDEEARGPQRAVGVADEGVDARPGEAHPEELRGDVFEGVGLVEDDGVVVGERLGAGEAVAQGEVGAEEVVVGDDDLRGLGARRIFVTKHSS